MTTPPHPDDAYRADADAWFALLDGLTPGDEELFLARLAQRTGKDVADVRAQWRGMARDGSATGSMRRVQAFFRPRTSPPPAPAA
jgi:hypothetical protein